MKRLRLIALALLCLLALGCSSARWPETPRRQAAVSFTVSDGCRVTSATAALTEKSWLLGEWTTTATLAMTPQGPRGQVQDAKTKNTLQSLGSAAIGAALAWLTKP